MDQKGHGATVLRGVSCLFHGTFSEHDISQSVRVGGARLHGFEGAPLRDLLDLSLRQVVAKEGGHETDALAQVLQDGK